MWRKTDIEKEREKKNLLVYGKSKNIASLGERLCRRHYYTVHNFEHGPETEHDPWHSRTL